MLQVRKLTITFGERQVVRDLSFTLADGEKVGLVGDNGAGKTSLVRAIYGDLQPDDGDILLTRRRPDSVCYIPQHLTLRGVQREADVLSFLLDGRGLRALSRRLAEIDALLKGALAPARLEELVNERVRLEEEEFGLLEEQAREGEAALLAAGEGGDFLVEMDAAQPHAD